MTTPFELYQWLLNLPDEEVEMFLKTLTLESLDDIKAILDLHNENPDIRTSQKAMAKSLVGLIHGKGAAEEAI